MRRGRRRALGIARTAWLFGPPGRRLPGRDPRRRRSRRRGRRAAARRRRRVGHAHLHPRRRRGDRGAARRRTRSAGSTTSSTAASPPAPTGPATSLRQAGIDVAIEDVPASTWPRASTPPAWAVLAPTPLPGGEPLRPWPAALADYAADAPRGQARGGAREPMTDRTAAVGAARRPLRRDRPPWRQPRRVPRAVAGVAFPALTRPTPARRRERAAFVQANLSSSAAGVLRGLHYHRRQLDYWVVATGRAFVALVDVRPVVDGHGRARRRRDPRAGRRRLGRHPDRRRPRLPRPRAARAASTSSRTSSTAATSSASPGTTRPSRVPWPPIAGDARRPADPVRSRPLEPLARGARGQPRAGADARADRRP